MQIRNLFSSFPRSRSRLLPRSLSFLFPSGTTLSKPGVGLFSYRLGPLVPSLVGPPFRSYGEHFAFPTRFQVWRTWNCTENVTFRFVSFRRLGTFVTQCFQSRVFSLLFPFFFSFLEEIQSQALENIFRKEEQSARGGTEKGYLKRKCLDFQFHLQTS